MRTIHRKIVSALIFSSDNKLLLGKKHPAGGGVYSNVWHIPGGGIDEGESQLEALNRELQEEIGIDITDANVILADDKGSGESNKTLKSGEVVNCMMEFNVYKVELSENSAKIKLTPTDDLVELRWIELKELASLEHTPPSIALFKRLGLLL